jgi:hypothetical protein
MSAPPSAALSAITFQLAATLDTYELLFDKLMRNWPDMEGYGAVSRSIDELRLYSASLPELAVQYVSLLIAHSELVHCLWKGTTPGGCPDDHLADAREGHRLAIAALRRKCLRALAEQAARGQHRPR